MLKINRLRIEIETENGQYGVDESFDSGLNFLASEDNTCGKSSILEAIYYCLGFEEIIGGKGEKVLTSVYKTFIEDGEKKLHVLEAKMYLEISNGIEIISLFRSAKMENRDTKLISVFFSKLKDINNKDTLVEDMYVHMQNAAVNDKGFHHFLEKFLHLDLPTVPSTDGNQRKLYLQLLFSCMFIEQKHGWGDLFSGMPYLGIKDSKKRVIEFVLNLDTLVNEKNKEYLKSEEYKIKSEWELHVRELFNAVNRETCSIIGVPLKPCIINAINMTGVHVLKDDKDVEEYLENQKEEYKKLEVINPKVIDNFDKLQHELEEIETDIEKYKEDINVLRKQVLHEKASIQVLNSNLEVVENDLKNNKDAARLRDLGSKVGCSVSENICPICQQKISDTLLPTIEGMEIMSIDENIRHLEAQKIMLNYARESHIKSRDEMDRKIQMLMGKVFSLQRLAKAVRSDLYSVDDSVSETIVYKKIDVQSKIEKIETLLSFVEGKKSKLLDLSKDWKKYLEDKEKVPTQKFTQLDLEKLSLLREHFVANLKTYGYKSVANMDEISISKETYLPVIEEFDMKFDSSASDNIRGIWAYTVALMQVSMEKGGNHPNVLIFDEPNQHSIVPENMSSFFESILNLGNACQTIVGITIKDSDTKATLEEIEDKSYKLIMVQNKALQKMD